MKQNSLLVVCVWLWAFLPTQAQNPRVLNGKVFDAEGKPLQYVGVTFEGAKRFYTSTDATGYYSLQIDEQEARKRENLEVRFELKDYEGRTVRIPYAKRYEHYTIRLFRQDDKRLRLAVLPFCPLSGSNPEFYSEFVMSTASKVLEDLAPDKVRFILPELVYQEMAHLNLSIDDYCQKDQAKLYELGKNLGCTDIVWGSYQLINNDFLLQCTYLDVPQNTHKHNCIFSKSNSINSLTVLHNQILQELLACFGVNFTAEQKKHINDYTEGSTYNQVAYTYMLKGFIWMNKGNYTEADKNFQESEKLDNQNPINYYFRGLNAQKQDKNEEAQKLFQKAQEVSKSASFKKYLKRESEKTGAIFEELIPQYNKRSKKWGYVNSNDKVVIYYEYDYAKNFNKYSLGEVGKDGKVGCIDKTGKVIIPIDFKYILPFDDYGVAEVGKDDKKGFINKIGKMVIPFEYDEIEYQDGLASVSQNKRYGAINYKGEIIAPCEYNKNNISPSDGLVCKKLIHKDITTPKTETDPDDEIVSPKTETDPDDDIVSPKTEKDPDDEIAVSKDLWGVIDKNNNIVIDFKYDSSIYFSDGIAKVEENGKRIKINKKGEVVGEW